MPPQQHLFDSTSDAYNASQCDDNIKDGDVLVVPSEGVIGFMYGAWPIAVVYADDDPGAFHVLGEDADITCLGKSERKEAWFTIDPVNGEPYKKLEVFPAKPGKDYSESVKLCKDIASSDGDITGWEHWKNIDTAGPKAHEWEGDRS